MFDLITINEILVNEAAVPWLAIATIGSALISSSSASKQRKQSKQQYDEQLALQKEQQELLEKEKQAYRDIEFTNPYKDMQNVFAGMENPYEDMENTMEDLTVNQQQAQFMAQQGAQQRANILDGLRRSAGASGVAGLAQALANQGRLQAQQASASIAQQEQRNKQLAAKEGARLQTLEAQGAFAIDRMQRQADLQADMAFRAGEAMVQEAEAARQATILGMQLGSTTGANQGAQQAYSNQLYSNQYANQMQMQNLSNFASLIGQVPSGTFSNMGPLNTIGQGGGGTFGTILGDIEPAIATYTG